MLKLELKLEIVHRKHGIWYNVEIPDYGLHTRSEISFEDAEDMLFAKDGIIASLIWQNNYQVDYKIRIKAHKKQTGLSIREVR